MLSLIISYLQIPKYTPADFEISNSLIISTVLFKATTCNAESVRNSRLSLIEGAISRLARNKTPEQPFGCEDFYDEHNAESALL